jgi:hypothetical protein
VFLSLSIHPGGVKWIMIFGKDFDRTGWIKRFLRICNYVKELLWFWNQKFSCCMTQVCLYESLIFVKSASSWYQRQFNSSLPCPFLCCQAWNNCLPNWNFFNFLHHPWCVSCSSSQDMLRTFLPWVDHEILDLLKDPSSRSHFLFPLVQLSNIVKWRNRSFVTSWINPF